VHSIFHPSANLYGKWGSFLKYHLYNGFVGTVAVLTTLCLYIFCEQYKEIFVICKYLIPVTNVFTWFMSCRWPQKARNMSVMNVYIE